MMHRLREGTGAPAGTAAVRVRRGVDQDGGVRALIGVNAALALLLELALLGAAVAIGLLLPTALPIRVAVAVLLPVAVVVVWGIWLAPRSLRRLGPRGGLLLQAVLFAVAVVGLAAAGQVGWAALLALLAAARFVLGARLGRI